MEHRKGLKSDKAAIPQEIEGATTQHTNIHSATRRAELREHFAQAHASSRLEGHVPAPEYLRDCEDVIAGAMTLDELQARSLDRAKARDRAARLA